MSSSLRIVMAQINPLVGDIEGNAELIISAAQAARDRHQAHAILFPELTLTGYPPEDLLLRAGLYRRCQQALTKIVAAVDGITLVVGAPTEEAGSYFNSALVMRDGETIATYHKQCLPNYSVFDEQRYFEAGTQACVVEVNGVPVGITICEDIWESRPTALAAQAGAKLILNLNASPYYYGKGEQREENLRARTNESGLPIIYTNLVGGQDELVFDGGSLVINGQGEVTQRAPFFEAGLFPVDLTVGESVSPVATQCVEHPDEEASVYQALVCGVRDYIEKNGFVGAVLGLSGGIDSALVLAIAVDAIGAERVEAVMMPSQYTADMSVDDAAEEANILGVDYQSITIEPLYQAFLASLEAEFAGKPVDTTEENIQARCRGVLLMAISNKKHLIVLTTGNKSEMAVGYATLYGDMAGGFDVLKDVPKTLVFRLARYRNSLSQVIPERVIVRPPSAELAPDQKDEDSLPPYPVLDAILELYVEQEQCIEEIVEQGYELDVVIDVVKKVDLNEYKRRQAAPGVKITKRAFGKDRRYPITSGYNRSRTRK